jgi:hypothetical protein
MNSDLQFDGRLALPAPGTLLAGLLLLLRPARR